MAPDVERIIQSIGLGDQDAVQLLLDNYNTQHAECFFFNTEAQERKKQQRLEEFRKNKIRDCAPDSDSDMDSDDEKPDLLLREDLAAALLCFVSGQLQPGVLRACLHTLRILSRDRRALGPMVTDSALFTLAHLGGIDLLQPCQQQDGMTEAQRDRTQRSDCQGSTDADERCDVSFSDPNKEASGLDTNDCYGHRLKQRENEGPLVLAPGKKDAREEESQEERKEDDWDVCRKEAMKVLCNIIYNSPRAQERASALRLLQGLWESLKQGMWSRAPPTGQFYKLRLLFLLTALRPELRLQLQQERGVLVLTQALEQCLALRWSEGHQLVTDGKAPPISQEVSQDVIEILKTIFNIAHRFYRQEPDEEEAALYRHLAAVLRYCLLLSCDGPDTREELQGHTVNILSALPLTCLDVLLAVPVDQASHKHEGINMDCVHALLLFMDRRLNRGLKLKEKLTPVLSLLTESSRVHRETRHYLRQKILPPLRDVAVRPEQDNTLRGQLVRLMTHVDTDVKDCAAELLFVLCKENGTVPLLQPWELQDQIIQPMGVTADGRLAPLWGQMRGCTEELEEEEEEEE
ncbi:PREDICTED: synembryn-A-like, partial [Cyprinodon variegatus]